MRTTFIIAIMASSITAAILTTLGLLGKPQDRIAALLILGISFWLGRFIPILYLVSKRQIPHIQVSDITGAMVTGILLALTIASSIWMADLPAWISLLVSLVGIYAGARVSQLIIAARASSPAPPAEEG